MLVRAQLSPVGYTIQKSIEDCGFPFSLDFHMDYPYEYNENVDGYTLVKNNIFVQLGLLEAVRALGADIVLNGIEASFIFGEEKDEKLLSDTFSFLLKTFKLVNILKINNEVIGFLCNGIRDRDCKEIFDTLFANGEFSCLLQEIYNPVTDKEIFNFRYKRISYEYVSERSDVKPNKIIDYYKTICRKYDEPFHFYASGFEKSELEDEEWFNNLMASFKKAIAHFYQIGSNEILLGIVLSEETEKQGEYMEEQKKQMGI